jgi:predicted SAM-dependent methyltransferase
MQMFAVRKGSYVTSPQFDLAPEFEYQTYISHPLNADLYALDNVAATRHYREFGEDEGRVCSRIDGRGPFKALIPPSLELLEIGPFCIPSFTRPEYNVRFLDAFDQQTLQREAAKYDWGNPANVPYIDYVWKGESYRSLIDADFGAVYSSHNIEHQPCLVSHLKDVASVLKPNGRFFLTIPDRRYSFDHFLPDTTIAEVIDAYVSRRTVHTTRNIVLHQSLLCHNDPDRHWLGDHGDDPSQKAIEAGRIGLIQNCLERMQSAANNGQAPYIDAHAWQFTPTSFKNLVAILRAMKLTQFAIERIYPTLRPANEFYAVLRLDP